MHMNRARLLTAAVGLALVLVVGTLAFAMSRGIGTKAAGRTDIRGQQMPAFSLTRFDGAPFDLRQHAGGPVLVYFWASWCVPCQVEAPIIQKLWPEYQQRGYTFVGVDVWDAESDARRFIERNGLTFPTVADSNGRVYVEYGVATLPDWYFLEPGLRARTRYQGPLAEEGLRKLLDELARPGGAS